MQLREKYPQLEQVQIEFHFDDQRHPVPSPQSYAYFPAARSFFRYACPCHSCTGEFDITPLVAELAGRSGSKPRSRAISLHCPGERAVDHNARTACQIDARIRVSIIPHGETKP